MKFKTLERCTLSGTRLEGQTAVLKPPPYYESRDRSSRIPFRVKIVRAKKIAYARTPQELCEKLKIITPTLKEFSTAKPNVLCFLLAFLGEGHRPIRDNVLWREWAEEAGRQLNELLPQVNGDILVWRHLDFVERKSTFETRIETNRFNVATGRFEKRKSAVA